MFKSTTQDHIAIRCIVWWLVATYINLSMSRWNPLGFREKFFLCFRGTDPSVLEYIIKPGRCVVCLLSRLFGNSRSAGLWPPRLQSRENQTVPDDDEGPNLCSRLHCGCYYCWCLSHSSETQAVKKDHFHPSAILHPVNELNNVLCISNVVQIPASRPTLFIVWKNNDDQIFSFRLVWWKNKV